MTDEESLLEQYANLVIEEGYAWAVKAVDEVPETQATDAMQIAESWANLAINPSTEESME